MTDTAFYSRLRQILCNLEFPYREAVELLKEEGWTHYSQDDEEFQLLKGYLDEHEPHIMDAFLSDSRFYEAFFEALSEKSQKNTKTLTLRYLNLPFLALENMRWDDTQLLDGNFKDGLFELSMNNSSLSRCQFEDSQIQLVLTFSQFVSTYFYSCQAPEGISPLDLRHYSTVRDVKLSNCSFPGIKVSNSLLASVSIYESDVDDFEIESNQAVNYLRITGSSAKRMKASYASFHYAMFEESDFTGSSFGEKQTPGNDNVSFNDVSFIKVNFTDSKWKNIWFRSAEWVNCDLSNAEFRDCGFSSTETCNFYNCDLKGTVFVNCTLSPVLHAALVRDGAIVQ